MVSAAFLFEESFLLLDLIYTARVILELLLMQSSQLWFLPGLAGVLAQLIPKEIKKGDGVWGLVKPQEVLDKMLFLLNCTLEALQVRRQ